jgi:GLPGLI family protein
MFVLVFKLNITMMKQKLLLLPALVLCIYTANAQKTDTAKLTVRYKFSHLRDTTDRTKPYTENMILFLGRSASAYKSYDRKIQEALMRQQMAQQIADQRGSGQVRVNIQNRVPTTNTEYYQFAADKKFIRKERLITPYLVEEEMPAISWKISSDTASFGGMRCQKATAHFKGRDYTAWFAPEMPFHAGPWKLNGLPGLILEAYDANKEVVFKFDGMEEAKPFEKSKEEAQQQGMPTVRMFGMEDANEDPNVIKVPTDAVKTSEKEFAKLQEAMRKDPTAFAQAAMAAQGIRLGGGGPGGVGEAGRPTSNIRIQNGGGPVINNPLELPEKK